MNNANFIAMLGGGGLSSLSDNQSQKCNQILSFKAGKMVTELLTTGKYLIKPDLRRGTINLSWKVSFMNSAGRSSETSYGVLLFEWKDRRTCATIDSFTILPSDNCSYTKVDTGREGDRVYLFQFGKLKDRRYFYWMQDNNIKNVDEVNCVKMNMYICDPEEAALASKNTNPGKDENRNMMFSQSGNISRTDSRKLVMCDLNNDTLIETMQGLKEEIITESGEQRNTSDKPFIVTGVSGTTSGQQQTRNKTPLTHPRIQSTTLSNILEVMGLSQPKNDISLLAPISNPSTIANCISSVPLENEANSKPTTTHSILEYLPPTILLPKRNKAVTFSNIPWANKVPNFGVDKSYGNATNSEVSDQISALKQTEPQLSIYPPARNTNVTLFDLQGAMAGLATTSPNPEFYGLYLTRLMSTEVIEKSGILKNKAVRARLLKFLPKHQRTDESIIENLRSPQVAQYLRDLTSIICNVNDEESLQDYNDILVNFRLNPEDKVFKIGSTNPIYGFLECIMKKVEEEKSQELLRNEVSEDKEGLPEENDKNTDMSDE